MRCKSSETKVKLAIIFMTQHIGWCALSVGAHDFNVLHQRERTKTTSFHILYRQLKREKLNAVRCRFEMCHQLSSLRCKALDVASLVVCVRGVSLARFVHESRSMSSQFPTLSQKQLDLCSEHLVADPKRMPLFTPLHPL